MISCKLSHNISLSAGERQPATVWLQENAPCRSPSHCPGCYALKFITTLCCSNNCTWQEYYNRLVPRTRRTPLRLALLLPFFPCSSLVRPSLDCWSRMVPSSHPPLLRLTLRLSQTSPPLPFSLTQTSPNKSCACLIPSCPLLLRRPKLTQTAICVFI